MNDIFISYSRHNQVFTQKLYEHLAEAKRSVWADWDSIPAASDWFAEIKQGIEETDSVIFVLSPEWIKSNECRKEMEYAVKMGKRLFPILYIPVDPKDVPPELAKLNWVFLRDTDDFDRGFQTLCAAMDTDLDWIKTHTRIQVRALEWEKKKRSASFVLRGEDLIEGEHFLASGANKNPVPTQLQSEYILASRQDATRRQHRTLAGVTVALVVSIALGVVAFFQRQDAVEQAKSASARQWAAEANAILASPNGNVETAALLSLRAFQVQDDYVPSADAALVASLNRLYTIRVFDQHPAKLSTVAYSPKGNQVAIGYVDGTAGLYNANTGKELKRFEGFSGYDRDRNPEYAGVHAVTFSSSGTYLLVAGSDEHILVWNLATGSKANEFTFQENLPLWSAKFSPDDKYILIGTGDPYSGPGSAYLIERSTGHLIDLIPSSKNIQERFISDVEFSKDGKMMLSTSFDGTAILWDMHWDTLTISPRNTFTSPFPFRDGAISADGRFVLLGGDNGIAELYSIDGELKKQFIGHTNTIFSVNFSPMEGYILTGSWDGTARLWEIESGRAIRVFVNHKDWVHSAAFSPDGKYILTGSFDNTARLRLADPMHDARTIYGHSDRINSVSYSPDGKAILSASRDNSVRLWNSNTLEEAEDDIKLSESLLDPRAVFSAGGNWIAAASEAYQKPDPNIVFWKKEGTKYPQPVVIQTNHISSLVFSPASTHGDSEYLLTGYEDGGMDVWQIVNGTWAVVRTFHGPSFPTGLAFTQDVKYIASTNHSNNSVPIFSIQNPDKAIADCVSQLSSDKTRGSWSIAFSNDRKYVAANLDNDVVIIDWQTNSNGSLPHECAQVEKLQGHSAEIRSLVFSPDGNYLLSTSLDGTAILWDAKTWQQLRTLLGHDGEITSAAFSPDSKFIVTGGADKTIRIWDTDYKDTIELVCSILNRFHRDFTDEERARYGITDHNPTCGT